MAKETPQQIRSSFFVSNTPRKMGGEEYPAVTVFVAEKNDEGKYMCFVDGYIANDGVVASAEVGSYSGASEVDFDVKLYDATLPQALAWFEKMESETRSSGQYTAEERVGDEELSPHFEAVKKEFGAVPVAKPRRARKFTP